ncbi:hypothetical protein GW916_04820 [bacterium]|nr:hypothetical protein [bacterium]
MPEVDLNELERYLRIYQQNPDSRVFAPLADMYRRLARYKEAEQICREGLQRHPYYAGGKVALAYILLDTSRLDEALGEVNAVVTYYPDNLMARKILVRVLAGMGDLAKAQREYQALLQLAPQVKGDPELERVLSASSAEKRDSHPESDDWGAAPKAMSGSVRVQSSYEKTEVDSSLYGPSSATPKFNIQSPRRAVLLKKKQILERWLQTLEA